MQICVQCTLTAYTFDTPLKDFAMPTRWALITGTSTGIGQAAAMRLVRDGVNVAAGIRRACDGDRLLADAAAVAREVPGSGRLVPLHLDVADESTLRRACETLRSLVGSDGLWALVNNAGIVVPGPVEHVPASEWRRQFDVNFFGIIELTRAVLPLLRQGVAEHGAHVPRVMIVSSIGGRIAQPINAPYTCSKWAATALGDSLRIELKHQGIGVTVLEPGAIATAIWRKGEDSATAFGPLHPARELYGQEIDGLTRLTARSAAGAIPAERAADALARALYARRAPGRVLVGRDAKLFALIKHWLPTSWFEAILSRAFGIRATSGN